MMETVATSARQVPTGTVTVTGTSSADLRSSSKSPGRLDQPRKARPLSQSHLDAFHAPLEVLQQYYTHERTSTGRDQHSSTTSFSARDEHNPHHSSHEFDVSPLNIPLSFLTPGSPQRHYHINNHLAGHMHPSNPRHSRDMVDTSSATSPVHSDKDDSTNMKYPLHDPVLTIRRSYGGGSSFSDPRKSSSSASLTTKLQELGLSSSSTTHSPGSPRYRRGSDTAIADDSDDHSPIGTPEHKGITFKAPFTDEEFPVPLTSRRPSCEESTCAHHHHRQSRSSTVSISCSSEPDVQRASLSQLEPEVAAEIHMQPMAPQMLVPLIDRGEEMRELLDNPHNQDWVRNTQAALGAECWDKKCIPLWTQTGRNALADCDWLVRSRELLVTTAASGVADRHLWVEFCNMIGWDVADEDRLPGLQMKRRGSAASVESTSSGMMSSIQEVEDEAAQ